jgi:hypothetical protein
MSGFVQVGRFRAVWRRRSGHNGAGRIVTINALQAFLSGALVMIVTAIWGLGRALRYILEEHRTS